MVSSIIRLVCSVTETSTPGTRWRTSAPEQQAAVLLSSTLRYHRTRSQDISSHYSLLKTKTAYSLLMGF